MLNFVLLRLHAAAPPDGPAPIIKTSAISLVIFYLDYLWLQIGLCKYIFQHFLWGSIYNMRHPQNNEQFSFFSSYNGSELLKFQ